MGKKLPLGKLNFDILERLLEKYAGILDERLVVGPKVGEDAAVIDFPNRYLIAKTDPITFAMDEIGWYAVHINANDIAIRGAQPRWFQPAILLPEGRSTESLVEEIFRQISRACRDLGATLVGGHTEITHSLDRPIVVGSMFGEVDKGKLVTTSGAKPGDDILLTKGIVIEGTAIIAREKYQDLRKRGYDEEFIRRCMDYLYNPGISVVKDALLANQFEIHSMHDPTEGGLATGLYEMARLIVALEKNGVRTVIVDRLDRLARDLMVQEAIIRDLRRAGVGLVSTHEGPDLCGGDPTRELMRQMFGAMEKYKALDAQKIIEAIAEKKSG